MGDSPAALTPAQMSDLLRELQERFGWGTSAERFEEVAGWDRPRSGSVFHRMAGRPNGPEVVVKWGPGWSPGTAVRTYEAMVDLVAVATTAATEDGRAIRPLAWSADPELIVMPYVEGVDVVSVLRRPDHPAWHDGARTLHAWMAQAGILLATYHSRVGEPSRGEVAPDVAEAETIARRARISRRRVAELLDAAVPSRIGRSFGDFGPGNLHAAGGGLLYLLDPPEEPSPALIHKDIGNFLFELRRQLAGRGFTRTRPVRGRFDEMRAAFVGGYSSAEGEGIGPADEALIHLFELRRAMGMARKRWPERPTDAAWFAATALAHRRAVGRYSPE